MTGPDATRDWGFRLEEVRVPAVIWQGGRDDVHTPVMARYLNEVLPNSTLVFVPEYATFNFVDRMDEILEAVLVA